MLDYGADWMRIAVPRMANGTGKFPSSGCTFVLELSHG